MLPASGLKTPVYLILINKGAVLVQVKYGKIEIERVYGKR
jgi:hypothetical protein